MNIFFLDADPVKAAQYQCNKHVVKLVTESAQLLSTCNHLRSKVELPDFIYRKTHENHPCNKWIRSNIFAYSWLCKHAIALCEEYTFRYEKTHKSQKIIEWCWHNVHNIEFDTKGCPVPYEVNFTNANLLKYLNPPQVIPEEFKIEGDVVQAYRNAYIGDKMKTMDCRWTKREQPWWTKGDTSER